MKVDVDLLMKYIMLEYPLILLFVYSSTLISTFVLVLGLHIYVKVFTISRFAEGWMKLIL